MRPRIKIVCFFYNEAALLPFFLSHYSFVDTIHAIVSQSTDATVEILKEAAVEYEQYAQASGEQVTKRKISVPRIIIEPFEFPAGMDDFLKSDKLNEVITRQDPDHDWLFVLDADEFIWPEGGIGIWDLGCHHARRNGAFPIANYLAEIPPAYNCLTAHMWNVYRHHTDSDLDITQEPIVLQRRHGVPDRHSGENFQYQKPIIIRTNQGFQYYVGNHHLNPHPGLKIAPNWSPGLNFDGAHWANADPSFAVRRRVRDRRDRLSTTNRQYGLGSQHFNITELQVLEQCRAHENDPQVF
jgi:hypothetical protein